MSAMMIRGMVVLASIVLIGCGKTSHQERAFQNATDSYTTPMNDDVVTSSGPNIPYLRQNHANYSQYDTPDTAPAPLKNPQELSLTWMIKAKSINDALILSDHIRFMKNRLSSGAIPRRWDQLFVMESFMKVNHYYTTQVEQNANVVVITKQATNACAFAVISAHADAVSGDFFARGNTTQNYSSVAQSILAQPMCASLREAIQAYLERNTMQGGMKR